MILRAMFYILRGSAIYPISIFLLIAIVFVLLLLYIIVRFQKDNAKIWGRYIDYE